MGEHTTLPRPPNLMWRGQSLPVPFPPQRLWRFDLGAFYATDPDGGAYDATETP